MLVAALLMATPLDALACTQIYVGSEYTDTGDTYVGRSEDYSTRYMKLFGVQEPVESPTYVSDESSFSWTYEGTTYRYTYVRDTDAAWGEPWPYAEAGTNEMGVSVSATETTYMNEDIEAVDPDPGTGIGEFNLADVILGTSATAREGVERIGALVDEYGSTGCNQIIIADSTETWIFMQLSGTQWAAILLGDDVVSVNPNKGNLQFKVDIDDETVCLHSERLVEVAQEAGTYTEYEDGTMNIAKSYGETSTSSPRYVQGQLYFGTDFQEGEDYTVSGSSVNITDPQLFFTLGSGSVPVTVMTGLRSFAARGEQSDDPAINANLGASSAIGSQRTTEAHMFQIREGLSSDIATIEWIALSPAEFNVFLPVYGALLTEVDETYYPGNDAVDVDGGFVTHDATENYETTFIDVIFMDINTIADANRDTMSKNVRGYLDAMQESIIEQQEIIDAAMQALPAGEARTELANSAFQAATEQLYAKADVLLDEMRAYVNAKGSADEFVPSDYDPATGEMKTPFLYADSVSAPTITTQPASATYKQNAKAADLTVEAEAAYNQDSLSYQWYKANGAVTSVDDALTGFSAVANATSATLSVDTVKAGTTTYVAVVENAAGLKAVSDPAVITVETVKDTTTDSDSDDNKGDETTKPGDDSSKPNDTTKKPAKKPTGNLAATGDPTTIILIGTSLAGVGALSAGVYVGWKRRRQ